MLPRTTRAGSHGAPPTVGSRAPCAGRGSSTVTFNDRGHKSKVTLAASNGRSYSCPTTVEDKLDPVEIRMGRITLTLHRVRRSLKAIEAAHPDRTAPDSVVTRYNRLGDREKRLVAAYNANVAQHNAILETDCTAS